MSSTNKTTHYELPQFVENDIFNPLVDDNDAYNKIDTALYNIADAEADDAAEIVGIKGRLDTAEGKVATLEEQNGTDVLTTVAQTLSGAVNELKSGEDSLDGRLDVVEDAINNATTGLSVKVAALETQNGSEVLTTAAQTLSAAVNELDNDIKNSNPIDPNEFGAYGDGVHDDTIALQAALNAGVVLLHGTYLISNMLEVSHSIIGNNSTIKFTSDGTNEKSAFLLTADNLTIENVNFDGLWDGTIEDEHAQYSMGIRITDVSNIIISNCTFKDIQGDALYFSSNSHNVLVKNVEVENVYRNCISYISCHDIYIYNCKFEKSNDFVAAIDFEPNNNLVDYIYNIFMEKCYIHAEESWCVNLVPTTTNPEITIKDIHFKECVMITDAAAEKAALHSTSDGRTLIGNLYVEKCTIDSKGVGSTLLLNSYKNVYVKECELKGIGERVSSAYGIFANGAIYFEKNKYSGNKRLTLNTPDTLFFLDNIVDIDNSDAGSAYIYSGVISTNAKRMIIKNNIITGYKGCLYISTDNAPEVIVVRDNQFNSDVNATNRAGAVISLSQDVTLKLFDFNDNGYYNIDLPIVADTSTYKISPSINTRERSRIVDNLVSSSSPETQSALSVLSHNKGDICWNTNPAAGGYVGWICTVAGTPGTWKQFGTIEA